MPSRDTARPTRLESGMYEIRWLDIEGRRRKKRFPSKEDASRELKRIRIEIDETRAGLRARPPPDRTFGELCDHWIGSVATLKRSRKHDESIIRAHLRPFFGSMLLRTISQESVRKFRLSRAALDDKTIHNHLTLLISMLRLAGPEDLGWLAKVPRIKKPKIRLFVEEFRYLRTTEEIQRFLQAARDEGEVVEVLYATALYTGLRAGELAALTWDSVSLEQRRITVNRSYDGPTKAGDLRYVPILDPLLALLKQWRPRCPGELLFPNRDGGMQVPSARIFQDVLRRVLSEGGFPDGYLTFHGLRHTFASHWMMSGGCIFKLQRILGHKSAAMTQRYSHLAPNAFVEDYRRLDSLSGAASVGDAQQASDHPVR